MFKLHHQLQAGAFPNCRKLAGELAVSAKTIQRDLDFMRERTTKEDAEGTADFMLRIESRLFECQSVAARAKPTS